MSCCNVGLILACCAVLASGVPDKLQPLKTRASSKIIGGTPAAGGEFPWHVSLQNNYDGQNWTHVCDGSIISSEFILTHAWCAYNPSRPRIVAGTLNLTTPGSIHNITEMITDDRTRRHLALVRVSPPFQFGCNTRPVQLPARFAETTAGSVFTVTAWVPLEIFEPYSTLFKLQSLIVPKDECSILLEGFVDLIYFICATDVNSLSEVNSMCSHQSYGAPLVHDGELRGVFYSPIYCDDRPTVYIEVSLFRDWIFRVTGV
ncbi:Hypothetical predicted protein [Cloeon dipterum]|uniref:Peptidase S1 domain-containing protein n=1 Tax=Cloeon dipterum TaxID=197152 RepID=A0A8S1DCH5_9INSE|nr:Hypothetical predicted protein [Cloeon dipterum]